MAPRSSGSTGLALAWLVASAAVASPGAPVVTGWARATYRMEAPCDVPAYRNNGFTQTVAGDQVTVETRATESWSRAGFEPPLMSSKLMSSKLMSSQLMTAKTDPVARFAREAASTARSRAEAVALVLQAIAARIQYRRTGPLPDLAGEVLAAGEASCVGMSNLAVAALGSLDIPARIARGLWVNPQTLEAVPHRWIEVFFPDAGWVFSDPTESVNYVAASHLVLSAPDRPDPDYDPRAAGALGLVAVDTIDRLVAVDLRPTARSGLGERRGRPAQYAAAVVGYVRPARAGRVRLTGGGLTWERRVLSGQAFSFPGLAAGEYALEASFGDAVQELYVRLGAAEVVQLEVKLP